MTRNDINPLVIAGGGGGAATPNSVGGASGTGDSLAGGNDVNLDPEDGLGGTQIAPGSSGRGVYPSSDGSGPPSGAGGNAGPGGGGGGYYGEGGGTSANGFRWRRIFLRQFGLLWTLFLHFFK